MRTEWYEYIIGAVFIFWKIPAAIAFTYFIWKVVNKKDELYATSYFATITIWGLAFSSPDKNDVIWLIAFVMFGLLIDILMSIKMAITELRTEIKGVKDKFREVIQDEKIRPEF